MAALLPAIIPPAFGRIKLSLAILIFARLFMPKNQYVVVREAGFIMTSPDGLEMDGSSVAHQRESAGIILGWASIPRWWGIKERFYPARTAINWSSRDSGSRINLYSFSLFRDAAMWAVGNDGILISK